MGSRGLVASHRAAWVWGKPSCCLKEDQISSQLVAWCYINSGMQRWHLIWTESAAEEILRTIRIPCSFKSTALLLVPSPTHWHGYPPRSPWVDFHRAALIRLNHHCPANKTPRGQSATTTGQGSSLQLLWGGDLPPWPPQVTAVCLPVKKKDLQRWRVTCFICFTPCFLY